GGPAVGAGAVGVGEGVGGGQVVAGQDLPCVPGLVAVDGEGGDALGDVGGRLGYAEVRHVLHRVAPVLLGDAEPFQHRLRAEPAGGDRERGALRTGQFGGQADGDPLDRGLDQVVVEADPLPEVLVVLRGAVGHLDHQASLAGQYQRERLGRGDQVGVDAHAE